jgi:hypothetical protein
MKNFGDVISAYDDGRFWQYEVRKIAGSISPSKWFDLAYSGGLPLANYYASTPLEMATLNGNRGIYKGSPDTGQKYIHKMCLSSTGSNNYNVGLMLLDYLAYIPFIDLDSTDPQDIINIDLPRYSDGSGVRVMAISQGIGTGVTTLDMTYLNQDGIEKTASTVLDASGNPVGGLMSNSTASTGRIWLNLAQGDYGIRNIISVTNNTSVGALCALVFVKPLCQMNTVELQTPFEVDYLFEKSSLPKVHNDAYLNFIAFNGYTSTIAPSLHGFINLIWEQ